MPDPYEGGALYFDKSTAPRTWSLIFLVPLLVILVSAFFSHAPLLVPLLSAIPLFLVWILFSTLHVSVTRKEVVVQYGLSGPKIPVTAIESCEAVDHAFQQHGGWGIRYGRDGSVAYNMLGDGGRAVRIKYRKGKKTKTVLLASRDPERLAAAVQLALREAAPPRP